MKKFLFILGMLFYGVSLYAQTTTVSATVVDTDGTIRANGSWGLQFTPNPSIPNISKYNINGTPLDPAIINQNGVMDNSGVFTFSTYQTAPITPVGSSWTLKVCPNATAPCGIYNFTLLELAWILVVL